MEIPRITLNQLFEDSLKKHNNPRYLNFKRGGSWQSISQQVASERLKWIALGLYHLGIRPGDKVALLSENRPEWLLSDLAILAIGAADVPIYTTQAIPQIEFILANSESKCILISTPALLERAQKPIIDINIKPVIMFEGKPDDERFLSLDEVEELGRRLDSEQPELYDELRKHVQPDDIATIIYTSGTTGEPKGVVLTHYNLVSNAIGSASGFTFYPNEDIALSYLPWTHIFERMLIYLYTHVGAQLWIAESIEKLPENFLEVRPHVMTTVPRMLEKGFERAQHVVEHAPALQRKIFNWAVVLALKYDPERRMSTGYRIKHAVADFLVYRKFRKAFGGRFRFIVSGGAALNPDLARIYCAAGITVLQGYGLTETSPVISVNRLERNRIGSVGPVIPNVAVKIAEDGEILVDGPNVMKEYYKNETATRAAFDCTWFKTGDIGYMDKDGFLYVTDRKKDLYKTSGGKFIAPQQIENMLTANLYIDKAVVIAEKRKFASALLFPNFEALEDFAKAEGIQYRTRKELIDDPKVQALYQKAVDEVNQRLSHWETIKKFSVIEGVLTIDDDYLTPTLKIKRQNVERRYHDLIENFYKE
ncbi:MAG: AMP-dependent synthetase/ligase [Bacteroidota bacterium]